MNKGFTQEELLQCYPPTKEQFLNNHAMIQEINRQIENYESLEKLCLEKIEEIQNIPITGVVIDNTKLKEWFNVSDDARKSKENLQEILSTTYHSNCTEGTK